MIDDFKFQLILKHKEKIHICEHLLSDSTLLVFNKEEAIRIHLSGMVNNFMLKLKQEGIFEKKGD